ncbi:MAG: hypothetical protein JWR40_3588 [Massilia sp.]|nr:hypothetical protein [Massilia sp.]
MDLMLDSLGDPLALKTLAASAGYSSVHFDRIFRELTGFSAVEYQRKRRLRRAAHLLRHEPDVAVFRIAQDCGFPSNAAFAKAFKQQFAMSAKAWRDGGWRNANPIVNTVTAAAIAVFVCFCRAIDSFIFSPKYRWGSVRPTAWRAIRAVANQLAVVEIGAPRLVSPGRPSSSH